MESFGSASGGRRIVIKPLSTVGDTGKPTHSVADDLLRVLDFIEDERHLVAYDLYLDIQSRLRKLKKLKLDHEQATAAEALRGIENKKKSWKKSKQPANVVVTFDEYSFNRAVDLLRENKEKLDLLKVSAMLRYICLSSPVHCNLSSSIAIQTTTWS